MPVIGYANHRRRGGTHRGGQSQDQRQHRGGQVGRCQHRVRPRWVRVEGARPAYAAPWTPYLPAWVPG